jgi:hypothetical protein
MTVGTSASSPRAAGSGLFLEPPGPAFRSAPDVARTEGPAITNARAGPVIHFNPASVRRRGSHERPELFGNLVVPRPAGLVALSDQLSVLSKGRARALNAWVANQPLAAFNPMKTKPPFVRGSRGSAMSLCLSLLAGMVAVPVAPAAPFFQLYDVWTPANSDLGAGTQPGIEPHFVYAIGVDWRDHVLVACEGRFNQGTDPSNIDGGPKHLLVRVSRDRGQTWSTDYKAETANVDSESWTNPAFVIDGAKTYLFYTGSLDGSGKDIFYREVFNTGSGAITFGPRQDITHLWADRVAHFGWNSHGPIGHGIKLLKGAHRGRVMLPFHHQKTSGTTPQTKLKSLDVLFKDPGGNWQVSTEVLENSLLEPQLTTTTADDVDPGESRIAERADGSFFMVSRKETNTWPVSGYPERRPRMRTAGNWSSTAPTAINWGDWVNATGITGTVKTDGGLLRFSDTAHLYSFSNNPANDGTNVRRHMAVRLSTDGGVNWPGSPKDIYASAVSSYTLPGAATYSDLARDSYGNIYCIFGRDGTKPDGSPGNHNQGPNAKVTVAKFNLEWVTGVATPTILMDNGASTFTTIGTWTNDSSVAGHCGTDFKKTTSGSATARWTPTIATAGNYEIYIRWTAGADRPSAVPITIKYNGGASTYTVPAADKPNQQIEGGTWHYLTTKYFAVGSGNWVEISGTAGTTTVADAVMFQKQ